MDFHVCLNAPEGPQSRLQIAKVGDYHDARYGDFAITEGDVEKWRTNLSVLPGGKALIDLDHMSDKPSPHRNTQAAGWITGVELQDGVPMADVEWTDIGREAIENKRYQFFSPSFGDYRDESGLHEDVLTGGALTNKPFLNMATVQLASDDRVSRAVLMNLSEDDTKIVLEMVAARNAKPKADSPGPMKLTADILKTLGIEDELAQKKILALADVDEPDEKKVLEAIEAAKPEPKKEGEKVKPTKTLEQIAQDEGKIVLDSAAFKSLTDDAKAGKQAKVQLDSLTFETSFDRAKGQGKAVEADREFYESLPLEAACKRLESAPKLLNTEPIGKNEGEEAAEAPKNVDPRGFQLDQAARKYMAENDMKPEQYIEAVHAVESQVAA